jgi:hypothetical protein
MKPLLTPPLPRWPVTASQMLIGAQTSAPPVGESP